MPVFQLQVWTIHIVFPCKHAKWYDIPIPIIAWHALNYIILSYEGSCNMCMSSSTTDIAFCFGACVWIFMDRVFSDVCWETLEAVRRDFLKKGYRNWVDHFWEIYSDSFYQHKVSLCGRHGFDRYGVYCSGDENPALLFEMCRNKRVNCRVDIGSRILVDLNSICLLIWGDQEP